MTARSTVGAAAVLLLWSMGAMQSAPAAAVVIDDFRTAPPTAQSPHLRQRSIGAGTATQRNLGGVFRGVRRLSITITQATLPGLDTVTATIVPTGSVLNYDSTEGADGCLELGYDGGGQGLKADWSSQRGISIDVAAADAAAIPCPVTLTLSDQSGHSVSAARTVTAAAAQSVLFPFTAFRGVDLRHIRAVSVIVDPGKAGDLQLSRIRTFAGTRRIRTFVGTK